MSDQPQAVLLDSNAYFRLACYIRPLLKGSFGDAPKYTLFVLAALDGEYRRSTRLQHKFECWSCIKLLKLMCSSGRIDNNKVTEILEYLQYENDLPMPLERLRRVYKEYFGTDCPI